MLRKQLDDLVVFFWTAWAWLFYWTMGQQEQAKQIWDKALKQFPKDEKLKEVMKRF